MNLPLKEVVQQVPERKLRRKERFKQSLIFCSDTNCFRF